MTTSMTTSVTGSAAAPGATRARRVAAPAAVIGGLALATLALALRDPHAKGSWGLCPSAAMGFDCPGCGGLRAVNDLTHGRLLDAASSNVLFVALLPVAVFLLGRWAFDAWRGTERPASALSTPLVVLLLVALGVFTVLRNLPGLGWLAA